jgi:RimJ/RimL family protein N-acetyltransferase
MENFWFRRLAPSDFSLMLGWLSKKHVGEWWDDDDDTLEKIAAHYGAADETQRFLLLDDSKPIGYFQYYFDDDETVGIDQFIGDETYLNRGVGEKTIKMFVGLIAEKHNPAFIILDPSPENARAVRCYEKVGFRHYETRELDGGERAYMMRLRIRPAGEPAKR